MAKKISYVEYKWVSNLVSVPCPLGALCMTMETGWLLYSPPAIGFCSSSPQRRHWTPRWTLNPNSSTAKNLTPPKSMEKTAGWRCRRYIAANGLNAKDLYFQSEQHTFKCTGLKMNGRTVFLISGFIIIIITFSKVFSFTWRNAGHDVVPSLLPLQKIKVKLKKIMNELLATLLSFR